MESQHKSRVFLQINYINPICHIHDIRQYNHGYIEVPPLEIPPPKL